jgi:hypothetical protein
MTSDDKDGALDPAAERLRRKLTRLLLVSGGIMMLGLIAVFGAIVYRLGILGEERAAPTRIGAAGPVEAAINVPADGRLVAAALDGGRALLTIQHSGGRLSLLLVDLETGATLGRYTLAPN